MLPNENSINFNWIKFKMKIKKKKGASVRGNVWLPPLRDVGSDQKQNLVFYTQTRLVIFQEKNRQKTNERTNEKWTVTQEPFWLESTLS